MSEQTHGIMQNWNSQRNDLSVDGVVRDKAEHEINEIVAQRNAPIYSQSLASPSQNPNSNLSQNPSQMLNQISIQDLRPSPNQNQYIIPGLQEMQCGMNENVQGSIHMSAYESMRGIARGDLHGSGNLRTQGGSMLQSNNLHSNQWNQQYNQVQYEQQFGRHSYSQNSNLYYTHQPQSAPYYSLRTGQVYAPLNNQAYKQQNNQIYNIFNNQQEQYPHHPYTGQYSPNPITLNNGRKHSRYDRFMEHSQIIQNHPLSNHSIIHPGTTPNTSMASTLKKSHATQQDSKFTIKHEEINPDSLPFYAKVEKLKQGIRERLNIQPRGKYDESLKSIISEPTKMLTLLPYQIPQIPQMANHKVLEFQSIPDFVSLSLQKFKRSINGDERTLSQKRTITLNNIESIQKENQFPTVECIQENVSFDNGIDRNRIQQNIISQEEILSTMNETQKPLESQSRRIVVPYTRNILKVPTLLFQAQRKALLPSQRNELSTWLENTSLLLHEIISVNQFVKIIEKNAELIVSICQRIYYQTLERKLATHSRNNKDGRSSPSSIFDFLMMNSGPSNVSCINESVDSHSSTKELEGDNHKNSIDQNHSDPNRNNVQIGISNLKKASYECVKNVNASTEEHISSNLLEYASPQDPPNLRDMEDIVNPIYSQYLTALVYLPVSFHSLDIVNQLVNKSCFPKDFLFIFIENSIQCCETEANLKDSPRDRPLFARNAQQRLVRLLCMFLKSLLMKNIIQASEVAYMVKPFCISFLTHQGARELFEFINTRDQQ